MNLLPVYEVWTWIKRYEGRFEISNRGRVRSWVQKGGISAKTKGGIKFISTPLIKASHKTKFGYYQVKIGNISKGDYRLIRIHYEVGLIYVHNPDPTNKVEVNHINGRKWCNEWWNFEWVTRLESIDHAFRTGLIKKSVGQAQSSTKLSNETVLEIYNSSRTKAELSREYKLPFTTISAIKNGQSWSWLTGAKNKRKYKNYDSDIVGD